MVCLRVLGFIEAAGQRWAAGSGKPYVTHPAPGAGHLGPCLPRLRIFPSKLRPGTPNSPGCVLGSRIRSQLSHTSSHFHRRFENLWPASRSCLP